MSNSTELDWGHTSDEGDLAPPDFDGPPEPPPTPLQRARILCELGRFGDAVPAVGALIASEPRNVEAWCLMAEAQLGAERAPAALEAARAATSLDGGLEQPHRLASLALSRLGREEEAAEAALQATECEPSSWQAHARLAHCLATFRLRLGEAREAADRALSLGPDEAGPHIAAGAVALAAGRRADAASAFCAALAADPQCSEAHNQLASVEAMGARRGPGAVLGRLSARAPWRSRAAVAGS